MEENMIESKIEANNVTLNQKEEIVRKSKEEGTQTENMVIEYNRIVDVAELINDCGCSTIAIRLATLLENGITQEMLEAKYMDISNGVSDKTVALRNLMSVCDIFIKYLSDIPNGVIIDPITGEVDTEKSIISAYECGILSDSDVLLIDPIKNAFEYHKETSIADLFSISELFSEEEIEFVKWSYKESLDDFFKFGKFELFDSEARGLFGNKKMNENEYEKTANKYQTTKEKMKEEEKIINENSAETPLDYNFMAKVIWFSKKDESVNFEFLKKALIKYSDSKLYKNILDENGEISFEKVKSYSTKWMEIYNKANFIRDTENYCEYIKDKKFNELNENDKVFLRHILARGYLSEDKIIQARFESLCEDLGIDTSLDAVLEATGCKSIYDLEQIRETHEINKVNYLSMISENKEFKFISESEKMIFELAELERINLYDPEKKEAIARLFVMFSEKKNEYEAHSHEYSIYEEVAKSIERYMLKNKEYYSEYLSTIKYDNTRVKSKANLDYVKKALADKEMPITTKSLVEAIGTKIEDKLTNLRGEDGKISRQEFEEFFHARSEELAISYEKERNVRNEERDKENPFIIETDDDKKIAKIYKPETVLDMSFAQAMLYFVNKGEIKGKDKKLLNDMMFKYRNSKYYVAVLDENGEVDFDKLKDFSEKWVEERNAASFKEDVSSFLLYRHRENLTYNDLNKVNKENLRHILARGYLSDNISNQNAFRTLCEMLQIDSDLESILKITKCESLVDLKKIKEDYDINSENYRYHIFEWKDKNVMSQGQKMFSEIAENLDMHKDCDREAIARLYLSYTEKKKEYPSNSLKGRLFEQMTKTIEKYMLSNKEYFSDYMTTIRHNGNVVKNKVEYAYIQKKLRGKELDGETKEAMARINYGIKVKIKELEQANGEITKEFIEEYFENREEDIASNYEMEKNERTKQKTIESIEKKQLEEGNNTVNENKVVSWIKNTATNIRDSFKNAATSIRNSFGKLLSKSDHSRLDSKETKLLEEPKKSLPNDKKEENRNFVPTCTVDINKAREETKKQKEEMNVSKEDTAEKTY